MNPRDDPEIQMLVQQSQAGSIIGRGGSKIKSLREVCSVWNSLDNQFREPALLTSFKNLSIITSSVFLNLHCVLNCLWL